VEAGEVAGQRDAPEAVDDRGDGREQIDDIAEHRGQPARCHVRGEQSDAQSEGSRDDERDRRREECADDQRPDIGEESPAAGDLRGVAQLGGDRVLRLCEQEQGHSGEDEQDQDAGDERGGREDPVAGADDSLRSSALTDRSRWLRLGSWWGGGPGGARLGDLCAGRHKCSSRDLWWNSGGPTGTEERRRDSAPLPGGYSSRSETEFNGVGFNGVGDRAHSATSIESMTSSICDRSSSDSGAEPAGSAADCCPSSETTNFSQALTMSTVS